VPSLLKSHKINDDLEFESLLCLASRLQPSQRLRPTKVGGIQRPEEFPALTTSRSLGENPRGYSILDKKYRNHKDRALKHCSLMGPWLPHGTAGLSKPISTSMHSLSLLNGPS